GLRRDFYQARVAESERKHEGPDGRGRDFAVGGRWSTVGRGHGDRVHGREYGSLAGFGVRCEGLPNSYGKFQSVQSGKAGPHGGLWRAVDARSICRRRDDKTVIPGHDRSRQNAKSGTPYLLGESTVKSRHDCRLLSDGRRDLESDTRGDSALLR